MALSRITDPAQTGARENLTLERLVSYIDVAVFPELVAALRQALDAARSNCRFAREHRNRRIAHIDLPTSCGLHPDPLPDVTLPNVEQALRSIREVLNGVERHFDDSDTGYADVILPDDGNTLLVRLRDAAAYREQRRAIRNRTQEDDIA